MTTLSDPAGSRAVLIGVHHYTDPETDDLPTVEPGLRRLASLLVDPEVWGLPPARCATLSQPSRTEVFDALHSAAAAAEDTLLLYFAGHGLLTGNSELHLALPHTTPDRLDHALRYDEIRSVVLKAKARCKVVILDCCWSGRAHAMAVDGRISDSTAIDGVFILTATSGTRQALAPPDEPYPVFTGELISVLEHGVEDAPPLLSMNHVYERLRRGLAARSKPVPEQTNSAMAGNACIVRNRARSLGPASIDWPLVPDPEAVAHHADAPAALRKWWESVTPPEPARNRLSAWAARERETGGLAANLTGIHWRSLRDTGAVMTPTAGKEYARLMQEFYRAAPDMDRLGRAFTDFARRAPHTAASTLWGTGIPTFRRNRVLLLRYAARTEPELVADLLRQAFVRSPLKVHDLCDAAGIPAPPLPLTRDFHQRLTSHPGQRWVQ
ncbi:caspase family protein [Streptomyces sp. NPDC006872]|uniref:caspase family protein n=1 Tax=Streptomyces sp. NPDC006872 TaxID=3155720 RepID=UPI0033D16A80